MVLSAINPAAAMLRERVATMALLEHLTGRLDLSFAPGRLEKAERCELASDLPAWASGLAPLAAASGIRLTPWRGTCAEAARITRRELPILTSRGGEWVALGAPRWRRVQLFRPTLDEAPELLSARELERRLGMSEGETTTWLLAEPLAPAATLIGKASGGQARPIDRLRALLYAEREDLGVVLAYSVGVGLLALATPIAAQVLINTVAFASLRQPIVLLTLALLACLVMAASLRALQRYAVEVLQRRIFVRMVADLSWRLPRVRLEAFDKASGPELVNRFFDVLTLQKAANGLLLDALGALLQASVGLALLALYHPLLLAFDLFLVSGVVFILAVLGRRAPATAIKESKAKYAVAGWLEELADHRWTFKSPAAAELALLRADSLAQDYLHARTAHFKVFFRQHASMLGFQALAAASLLGGGGWLVVEGQLTLGQLVAAEIIVASALAGLTKLSDKLETFYDLLAALDKLGQLVDLPLERQLGVVAPLPTEPARLELRDLSLDMGRSVLSMVELTLEPGERAAILGPDGSGKSLLADICAAMRAPTGGDILLDGLGLRELQPALARQHIALARAPEVITGTVLRNIDLGRHDVSRDDARRALETVGLLHEVLELPEGLDTPLMQGGAPLSEHQLRRLMIARAIVGRPRLLVVDSLLDGMRPALRQLLLEALAHPAAPWTLLIFTQDDEIADALPKRYLLRRGVLTHDG
ncbi:MAG: ATP-binding cassette domain-containing protein [Alphaproteobacteria bacterium]|nr:ATP-binding cassette domain-containing protein [Alphaproteobacteria bacterium]MCB9792652.1 ATP-binding cassette domain-containing protein [Alphaproteobacteria bacterium]